MVAAEDGEDFFYLLFTVGSLGFLEILEGLEIDFKKNFLMRTIFKVFIEFVTVLFLFFYVLVVFYFLFFGLKTRGILAPIVAQHRLSCPTACPLHWKSDS